MRIGILGGTFDPIHRGHIGMATAAADELGLGKIILLPDGDPPHKTPMTAGRHRLHMVELAAKSDPRFEASDMELRRPGRTYTVDTLLAYKKECPDCKLIYIVGSDTLHYFPTWRTADKVAALCDMAVVLRPGEDREKLQQLMQSLHRDYGLSSLLLNHVGHNISSTRIREMIQKGEDASPLLPPTVYQYILKEGLYQTT